MGVLGCEEALCKAGKSIDDIMKNLGGVFLHVIELAEGSGKERRK